MIVFLQMELKTMTSVYPAVHITLLLSTIWSVSPKLELADVTLA
jgi:hypothetical protein